MTNTNIAQLEKPAQPGPAKSGPNRPGPANAGTARAKPEILNFRTWEDPVADPFGHDPCSQYVELYWLPILGPTAIFLLRRLNIILQQNSGSFSIPRQHLAHELGISQWHGPNSPFGRALSRCCDFSMFHPQQGDLIYVRQRIPSLPKRLSRRLPERVRELYATSHGRAAGRPAPGSAPV